MVDRSCGWRNNIQNAIFHWTVFSAIGVREAEARRGAELFAGSRVKAPLLKTFPDGFMPYSGAEVKTVFEKELKQLSSGSGFYT